MRGTVRKAALSAAYWRLFVATGIDNVGNGAYAAAVPLLAVGLTHDPRLVAAISAATYLPWLLVSLPAGALADRRDRAGLMWRAQVAAGVLVSVTAILAAFARLGIGVLALLAFGLGTCDVVFGNAAQALLPEIVPGSLLPRANGNQQAVITAGQQFVGPPLGSGLFAVAAALPFGVDALSFFVSASLVSTLPKRQAVRERQSIRSGLAWLRRHRLLRTLALLLGVNTFCWQMANAALVLLATRELRVTVEGYGLLLAAAAVGSVFGGLVNARIVRRTGALPALVAGLVLNIVAFVGIGFSVNPFVLGGFLAVNGFATTMWTIVTTTVRQQLVPPGLLGRVTSVYKLLGWGLIPLGTLTGGVVAHAFGVRAPYELAGAVRTIALLAVLPALVASREPLQRPSKGFGGA